MPLFITGTSTNLRISRILLSQLSSYSTFLRIHDANASVQNVENCSGSTRLLSQTTLRNVLGTRSLSAILGEREEVASEMLSILDNATDAWGIKVERVEVKDVRLPVSMQRAMAAEAEAARDAKAKVQIQFDILISIFLYRYSYTIVMHFIPVRRKKWSNGYRV